MLSRLFLARLGSCCLGLWSFPSLVSLGADSSAFPSLVPRGPHGSQPSSTRSGTIWRPEVPRLRRLDKPQP